MKNIYLLLGIFYFLDFLNQISSTDLKISVLGNIKRQRTKRAIIQAENLEGLEISEMTINSHISNRYVHTAVTGKIRNIAGIARNAPFVVILPSDAFITEFVMEIEGKNYTSFVIDNEEARKKYDSALANGLGTDDDMSIDTRDSNVFAVSVSVEPHSYNKYYLSYQELLRRKHGRYEHSVTINPGQLVEKLHLQVSINEKGNLKNLKVLPLRTGDKIEDENLALDPTADIIATSKSSAVIKFAPNIETQKRFARLMNTDEKDGLFAQFVVQYDVEQDQDGGEMLTKDCYFVTFFAPTELQPLSKHVVFMLDVSGSMFGNKMTQLMQAMQTILGQLHENDRFNIATFCGKVKIWNLDNLLTSVTYSRARGLTRTSFPKAYPATPHYISIANSSNSEYELCSYTDILTSLEVSLRLVEVERLNKIDNVDRQPLIVFLTDGDPNIRDMSTTSITKKITALNTGMRKSSIHSISFGTSADPKFLEKLSLHNNGTSKHIYDDIDSAKQLESFFDEISSPVLYNVSFNFNPSQVSKLTKTHFPILYQGSEIVVSGQCGTSQIIDPPEIKAMSSRGPVTMRPVIKSSPADISRLWSFLTVKQLLDSRKTSNGSTDEIDKKIVGLALNSSFVTDLTAMVLPGPHDSAGVVGITEIESGLKANQSFPRATNRTRTAPPTGIKLNTELDASLPWLKNIFNNNNNTITLPSGNYKFETNETITDFSICWNSPLNGPGKCTLLSDCSIVHPLIESEDDYKKHFCTLKKGYAGICCTNSDENMRMKTTGALNLIYFMLSNLF